MASLAGAVITLTGAVQSLNSFRTINTVFIGTVNGFNVNATIGTMSELLYSYQSNLSMVAYFVVLFYV